MKKIKRRGWHGLQGLAYVQPNNVRSVEQSCRHKTDPRYEHFLIYLSKDFKCGALQDLAKFEFQFIYRLRASSSEFLIRAQSACTFLLETSACCNNFFSLVVSITQT
jgi:hypothetical protein